MIKVLTYGTFDLLHHGHIRLLERSRALGDHLTVAVSTDQFNLGKGKMCAYTYEERVHILEAIRYVGTVIPEKNWEQKIEDVKNHDIDIFVISPDSLFFSFAHLFLTHQIYSLTYSSTTK